MSKYRNKKIKDNSFYRKYLKVFLILIPLLITFLVFSNSLKNDFTNYDDELYVINNNYIKDLSINGIANIFKGFAKDELPVTLLSFAINFKFSGLDPYPYHAVNLLFHLLNVFLVFQLVMLLAKKINIAFIASLLFGVHPFRVESVSWVTERKDVLYTFFFLLSLICYIRYITCNYNSGYFAVAFLFFLLSILSKLAALTLPVIMLITDHYYERKLNFRVVSEKILFFIVPVVAGLFHYFNKEIVQINEMLVQNFPISDRIFLGSYALLFYIAGSVLPYKLTLIHPYPVKLNGSLPIEYYISAVVVLLLIVLFIFLVIRYHKKYRLVFYGMFFFIVSISIVLHIAPMGGNIVVGERYTYIAYIGLFMIPGYFIDKMLEIDSFLKFRNLIYLLTAVYLLFFCNMTYNRNNVWKNSITLWTDVINKNPDIYFAYNKRADKNLKLNNYQDAFNDLTLSLKLNPGFYETYNLRGTSRAYLKDYKGSLEDYNNAIKLNPAFPEAYKNRGLTKLYLGDLNGSLEDYNKAIDLKKAYPEAFNYRGYVKCLMKDYNSGIGDFDTAISLDGNYSDAYSNRGNAKAFINDFTGSVKDFTKVIELNPGDNSAYANRGNSKMNLNDSDGACRDWQVSANLGNEMASRMFRQYCSPVK